MEKNPVAQGKGGFKCGQEDSGAVRPVRDRQGLFLSLSRSC